MWLQLSQTQTRKDTTEPEASVATVESSMIMKPGHHFYSVTLSVCMGVGCAAE